MNVLPVDPPEARPDRFSTRLLHDEPNARVVAFRLAQGQAVPPHESACTVLVTVLEGAGLFRGAEGEVRLGAGESAVYTPGETHSMEADGGELRFLAVLTPRPG